MKLKLLQWNIWYKEDITNIITVLKDINPDIICLQELALSHPENTEGRDTLEELTKGFWFYYFFKPSHTDPANTFGNIILSRHPIKETFSTFILEPKEIISTFSDQGRIYIECTINVEGSELKVATTHMSYTDKFEMTELKKKETDNLIAILQQKKKNFVFTGDLNAVPDSYTVEEIGKVLTECGPTKDQKTWTTKPFSYNGFTADTLKWRLDYCFATPDIQIESSKIIDTTFSDHLPLLIEFTF